MDIKEILQANGSQLLDEELDMLEEELAGGEYDARYRQACENLLHSERRLRRTQNARAGKVTGGDGVARKRKKASLPSVVAVSAMTPEGELSPFNKVEVPVKSAFEIVSADLAAIRRSDKRKSLFREYIAAQSRVDEAFLDEHFSLFDEWEMGVILEKKKLSEAFLEKYFDALDADHVARKQLFSEEFFMKHYAAFDAQAVLKRGKNPWRKKDKRSKKLDTFLRLKGVTF